jgi:hypothetical protein
MGQLTSDANLIIINQDPGRVLENFVAADETWVHHFDPESKLQSMELKFSIFSKISCYHFIMKS